MEVLISRTSIWDEEEKPIDECDSKKLHVHWLDFRSVKTIEEARNMHWYNEWYKRGINHREENGFIVCDIPKSKVMHTLKIDTIEDIQSFIKKYGIIVIKQSSYKEFDIELEIYDDYRE